MSRASRALRSSPPAHRVGNRLMSWLDEVHTGHSPAGSAASVSPTTPASASAVKSAKMNGKLNVSCSSSSSLWNPAIASSVTHVSPSSNRGDG